MSTTYVIDLNGETCNWKDGLSRRGSRIRVPSATLARRLRETRRFIQAVTGPRQVGKTTLVRQVIDTHHLRARIESADEPTP
jgi:predicted AAA+ superfamily ATPase